MVEQLTVSKLVGKRGSSAVCPSSTLEVALPTLTPEYATGVYCWLNRVNGKRYIGSSATSLLGRMRGHRKSLVPGTHGNPHLQSAWNKYGSRKFAFVILERCAPEDCISREQFWINKYQSADRRFGYNISPTAGSTRGIVISDETKSKMSSASKKKWGIPEFRSKMIAAHQGRVVSDGALQNMKIAQNRPEVRAKIKTIKSDPAFMASMSAKLKEALQRPEVKAKVIAHCRDLGEGRRGKPLTVEHRAHVSAALKGKPFTSEHRLSISRGASRRRYTLAERERMSTSRKGHKVSAETRAKTSASLKRFYASKKVGAA